MKPKVFATANNERVSFALMSQRVLKMLKILIRGFGWYDTREDQLSDYASYIHA